MRLTPWLLLALLASCARAPDRPNVLLIVVDTLRPDHLSAYGYHRDTSPNLAALADRSARFTHAQTPRAKTTPAIASLFSGLYPHDHGVRDLAKRVDDDVPLLAEAFSEQGYRTIGIIGNYVMTDRRSGLARGFQVWVEDLPDLVGVPPNHAPQRRARSLTDGALVALGLREPGSRDGPGPHLAAVDARPWFLYLHYMDPHGAYDPPAEHALFAADGPDPIPLPGEEPEHPIQKLNLAEHNVPADAVLPDGRIDANRARDLYDGEIHFADAEIGRLLDGLRAAGMLENTLVVFVSDHGESLGEHLYWFEHGFFAYETTCRVPLLVSGPGVVPATVDADVSLVDLAPTLLELCGLDRLPRRKGLEPGSPRGVSRARLVRGRTAKGEHPVFSEKIERHDLSLTVQIKAVRIGDWKLIRRYTHREADRGVKREPVVLSEELYDLAADPGETVNLAGAPPPTAPLARLQAELVRFAEADVHFADLAQILQRERERLEREDPEVVRILESLGY